MLLETGRSSSRPGSIAQKQSSLLKLSEDSAAQATLGAGAEPNSFLLGILFKSRYAKTGRAEMSAVFAAKENHYEQHASGVTIRRKTGILDSQP